MRKLKLFFACLLMAVLSIGQVWGTDVTFSPGDSGGMSSTAGSISGTKGGVTVSISSGVDNGSDIRVYKNATMTITSTVGNITNIAFTFSGSNNGGWSASYTPNDASWESNAATGTQARVTNLVVTIADVAPSHTITAESNNTTYGTVSLTGSVITGSPKSGCRYASPAYTVTSGTATVAQSGDAFTVTPSSDCTVRINFEAIPTHNIIFNNGVKVISNAVVAEGASYAITEAVEDALIASCTYKHFEGWTLSSSIEDASVKPALVNSIDMEGADVNLYAVYSVTSGGGSNVSEEIASVDISEYATAHSWGSSSSDGQKELSINSDITATASAGSNTGKWYTDWRFYASESATITIGAGSDCTLKSVTFTFTPANGGTLTGEGGAASSGTAYTISGDSYSFAVGGSSGTKQGQIKFTAISVTYDKTTSGTTTYSLDAECAAPGQCVAPTFNHGTGTYNVAQSIELATTTEEADIYYTVDGSVPSKTNGTKYTAAFSVSENKTVKAIAVKAGNDDSDVAEAVFTFKPVTPAITKDVRHFMSTALVTIACETAGAAIHYTVDGSDPTASSPTYSTPFEITATTTVKAIAVKTNWNNSDIASETFTKATVLSVADARDAIDETPAGINNQYVEGKIYQIDGYNTTYKSITYWISDDGTSTNGLEVYSGKGLNGADFVAQTDLSIGDLVIVSGTLKKYNSTYEFDKNNEIVTLTRFVAAPTFSPEGAGFLTTLNVSLETTEEGGEIRYTVDGSDPTKSSALYSEPIELSETTTIKAATFKGEDVSAIITKTYTKATKINVTDALAALESENPIENQCVYGVVSTASASLYSGKLTYYISVDGETTNQLKVYNGKGLNGANFANKTDLQVGDLVTVFGTLKIYNEEKEFDAGNYLLEFKRLADPELEWSVASFDAYIGQENTFPTLSKPDGVTIVYSSSNETAATIDANTGAITLGTTPNVSTTITATLSDDENYKDDVATYTLNVYNAVNPGTITYEENGGSEVADVTTPVDNFPDPLPEPTKENYIFAGWWTTSTFDENTQAVAGAPMDGNVTLYAKWTEIPVWAYTYTSNVSIASSESKQVTIAGTDYDAAKSNKGTSATITLPQGVTTIHMHLVAWNGDNNSVVTVTGACFDDPIELTLSDHENVSGSAAKYDLGASGVDYYFSLTPDNAVAADEVITITAASGKRFVLFGVNQEGGVLPVLDHIAIGGEMTNTTGWKTGDNITPEGLTVNAYYTLNEVEQDPVDVTNDPALVWSHDALIEDQTEVTLTATYTDGEAKSANVNVTIEAVVSGEPEITTDVNSRSWTVDQNAATPAAKTVTVTLKNIATAQATLGGTNPEAFSISKTEGIVNGDVITISVLASTGTVASYSATITIKDDASDASKDVNLTLTVKEPEAAEEAVSTSSEWVVATEIADGMEVLITGVKSDVTYAISEQANNNRTTAAGTLSEDVFTPGENTMSFTLVAQEGENNYALRTSNGKYLYAASSGSNLLKTRDAIGDDGKAVWTISINGDNEASIVANCETENWRNVMQFNQNGNNNPVVACYASASQSPIKFYVPKQNTPVDPTPDYTRTVEINRYGTICLPNNGTIANAKLYDIDYYDGANTLYLLEVNGNAMEAGKPYIFLPSATSIEVTYTDDANEPAGSFHGLVGSYSQTEIDADAGNYILWQNAYYLVNSLAYVGENRAYIHMSDVPTTPTQNAGAPRRRVAMNVYNEQTTTDIDALNASEAPVKMIIDGNLYILRGEKLYNVNGQVVK